MNMFYAETLNGDGGQLGKEESHHASRVLRQNVGDTILTTLGRGVIYRSEIMEITKSQCRFKNTGIYKEEPEQDWHLHIAIAPTKSNDRFEFFLEKATEIGISEITPIICDHSERKVYKTDRGQKIITSAAKQSLACWWPVLHAPVRFSEFNIQDHKAQKFIAHCEYDDMPNILQQLPNYANVVMLIGPEGDFSPQEIKLARERGYTECGLGPKRLRTETAGIAVALAFNLR